MLNFWQKAIFVFLAVSFLWSGVAGNAQAAILPDCTPFGGVNDQPRACGVSDIFELIVNLFNFLLGLIALIFVLIMIVAGLRLALYQFADSPETELSGAKLMFRRGMFGLVVALMAFLLINTVLVILRVPGGYFNNIPQLGNFLQ